MIRKYSAFRRITAHNVYFNPRIPNHDQVHTYCLAHREHYPAYNHGQAAYLVKRILSVICLITVKFIALSIPHYLLYI